MTSKKLRGFPINNNLFNAIKNRVLAVILNKHELIANSIIATDTYR